MRSEKSIINELIELERIRKESWELNKSELDDGFYRGKIDGLKFVLNLT